MPDNKPRTVKEWASDLGVSENTVRTWTRTHGLITESTPGVMLIRPAELAAFFDRQPGLRSVRRAQTTYETAQKATASHPQDRPDGKADRDDLRTLRARIATLDQRLDEALEDASRARAERDYWQGRARAHRRSLRDQLDLEDQQDQPAP